MPTKAPLGIKARPFDFYVAFLVFFFGIYGFFDPDWPEQFDGWKYWLLMIEDMYLIVASLVIMGALIVKQVVKGGCSNRLLISSIVGEMFGWLFVSAAAGVIAVTSWVIPPSAIPLNDHMTTAWFFLWLGLAISAGMRYIDLRSLFRGKK